MRKLISFLKYTRLFFLFVAFALLETLLYFLLNIPITLALDPNTEIQKSILSININQDNSANVWYWIEIKNNNTEKLVSEISLVIPFVNIKNLKIEKNNQSVNYKVGTFEKYTKINIELGQYSIYPLKNEILKISFLVNDILKKQSNNTEKYALFVGELSGELSTYSITYNKSFGDLIFTNIENYKKKEFENEISIEYSEKKNGLFIIGKNSSLDIGFISSVSSKDSENKYYLFHILPNLSRQKHEYTTFYGADYGVYDEFGNRFAVFKLEDQTKQFNFVANVSIDNKNELIKIPKKYNFNINNLPTNIQQNMSKIFEGSEIDLKEAFKMLYKEILRTSQKTETHFPKVNLDNLKFISSISSQIEACGIIVFFAEKFGVNSVIKYGYLIYPELLSIEFGLPHLWCEIEINKNVYVLDPYLEKLTGNSFEMNNPLDRITMGIWHPSQKYNNVLGLLNNKPQKIIRNKIENRIEEDNTTTKLEMLISSLPRKAISGEWITGNIVFKNNTNKFFEVSSIEIKDTNYKFLDLANGLYFGILPYGNSLKTIKFSPVEDIYFEGEKNFVFLTKINDSELEISKEVKISFNQNKEKINQLNIQIIILIISGILSTLMLIYLIKSIFHKSVDNKQDDIEQLTKDED